MTGISILVPAATPFCVYKHVMESTVFYVGMGSISRAFDAGNRNKIWRQYAGNRDFLVEVISLHETEESAHKEEKHLIEQWRPACNMRGTGRDFPPERRAAITARLMGHPCNAETRAKISDRIRKAYARGAFIGKMRPIMCINSGEVWRSTHDASLKIGVRSRTLYDQMQHGRPTAGGFHLVYLLTVPPRYSSAKNISD